MRNAPGRPGGVHGVAGGAGARGLGPGPGPSRSRALEAGPRGRAFRPRPPRRHPARRARPLAPPRMRPRALAGQRHPVPCARSPRGCGASRPRTASPPTQPRPPATSRKVIVNRDACPARFGAGGSYPPREAGRPGRPPPQGPPVRHPHPGGRRGAPHRHGGRPFCARRLCPPTVFADCVRRLCLRGHRQPPAPQTAAPAAVRRSGGHRAPPRPARPSVGSVGRATRPRRCGQPEAR